MSTRPNTFDHQDTFATLNAQAGISTTSASPAKPDNSNKPPVHSRAGTGSDQPSTPDSCCSEQVLHSASIPVAPTTESKLLTGTTPFFTYQIVFVPDLTQKHYLRIHGGPGEVRATLNMVNGWMFTGIGPFYLKDSSTAQNILATGVLAKFAGSGAADVINSVADLSKTLQTGGNKPSTLHDLLAYQAHLTEMMLQERPADGQCVQAEIHVYEPHLTPEGAMEWREINSGNTDMTGECPRATSRMDGKAIAPLMFHPEDLMSLAKEEALSQPPPVIQYSVSNPFDPALAQADKAALQALTPPVPQQRPGFLGGLCHPKRLFNGAVTGPTAVTAPGAVPAPQPPVLLMPYEWAQPPAVCPPAVMPPAPMETGVQGVPAAPMPTVPPSPQKP
jgi:hypothetical protein